MDLQALAEAVAARYASGALTPPAGEDAVRLATAEAPGGLDPSTLPAVLVFAALDPASFEEGNQTRVGVVPITVEFYLGLEVDLPAQMTRLYKWAGVLLNAHGAHVQLGIPSVVALTRARTLQIGDITYAGVDYPGIKLGLAVTTTEPWSPTA